MHFALSTAIGFLLLFAGFRLFYDSVILSSFLRRRLPSTSLNTVRQDRTRILAVSDFRVPERRHAYGPCDAIRVRSVAVSTVR